MICLLFPLLTILGFTSPVLAGSFNYDISLELRRFTEDQAPDESFDEDATLSFIPEWESEKGSYSLRLSALARIAANDSNRSRVILQDNFLKYEYDHWSFGLGTRTYTWTIMEAFQTIEIINSREWDGNLENFYRIGEWVAELRHDLLGGQLSWMLMPVFTAPILPSEKSRLGFGVDFDTPVFVNIDDSVDDGFLATQMAVRWEISTADADISVLAAQHVDRNFFLLGASEFNEVSPGVLVPAGSSTQPVFFMSRKFGASVVYSLSESTLLKTEMLNKIFPSDRAVLTTGGERFALNYAVMSFGIEKSFGFWDSVEQLFLAEYQGVYGDLDREERLQTEVFQNDLFLAWRFSFSGLNESELQVGCFYDFDEPPQNLYVISYSQRWREKYRWKLGYRHFDAPSDRGVSNLQVYNKDHHAYLNLTASF